MTTRVYGRIVEPDGDAASLDPADGYVRYTIAEPGVAEGAVRARGVVTARVAGGVVEDVWLAGWRIAAAASGHQVLWHQECITVSIQVWRPTAG